MCDHRISDILKYKMQTAVGNPKNSRTRNASNYVDTLPDTNVSNTEKFIFLCRIYFLLL